MLKNTDGFDLDIPIENTLSGSDDSKKILKSRLYDFEAFYKVYVIH